VRAVRAPHGQPAGVAGVLRDELGRDRPAELARAIRVLYEVPELRNRLGRCGRERIESSLTWEHSLARLAEVYGRFGAPATSRFSQEAI